MNHEVVEIRKVTVHEAFATVDFKVHARRQKAKLMKCNRANSWLTDNQRANVG